MTDMPRAVWYTQTGNPMDAEAVKVREWANSTMISRLQLADGTHRNHVPYFGYDTLPSSGAYAFLRSPLPDLDAAELAIREGRMIPTWGSSGGSEEEAFDIAAAPDSDPGDEDDHGRGPKHEPGTDPQPGHGNDDHGHSQGGKGHSDPQPGQGNDGQHGHGSAGSGGAGSATGSGGSGGSPGKSGEAPGHGGEGHGKGHDQDSGSNERF